MSKRELMKLNLSLFDDGGAEGAAGAGALSTGESAVAAAQQTEGRADDANGQDDAAQARQAQWAQYKKDFKEEYDRDVQNIVKGRLKDAKADSDRLKSLNPIIELLGDKYGVSDGDAKKLLEAIENDNSYFEDEAAEKGMTVEQLKEVKRLQRENAQLREAQAAAEAQALVDEQVKNWVEEAEGLKQVYPNFDLGNELSNERFRFLMNIPGMDLRTAFEMVHKDELLQAGMLVATKRAKEAVVNSIKANGQRPTENVTGNSPAGKASIDPSKLTDEQLQELSERARRGEIITLR